MRKITHIRSTFKHALIYSGANILAKAVGFIMLPVYAFHLRGEGYGIIGMIEVVISVLVLLIGYGISGAMRRFYFQKPAQVDKNIFVSTNVILMFFLVVAIAIPALIFNEEIASFAFGKQGMGFFITLALYTFIADITSKNAENYILIKQQSYLYSGLALARLIVGLTLNIYLIVYLKLGVLGYLYSGLITAVLFSLIMHIYTLYHVGVHFKLEDAHEILAFSLPLLPGYVAMFFRNNADRVMLRCYLGLTQLGAFEMLFKFATLIGVLVTEPFMKSWDVKRFEICNSLEGPVTMARYFTYQLSINMFLGLILALEIPILLRILTPEEFWLSGGLAFLAVTSRIVLDSYYQFFFGLLYAKRTILISLIQFISAGLSVFFSWLLIKHYGLWGAVTSACIVNSIQSALGYIYAQRYYKIPYEWTKVSMIIGFVCTLFLIINLLSFEGTPFGFWLNTVLNGPVITMMQLLHMDQIGDGKFMTYVINSIPMIFEGGLKFLLACVFPILLVLFGIIPKGFLKGIKSDTQVARRINYLNG